MAALLLRRLSGTHRVIVPLAAAAAGRPQPSRTWRRRAKGLGVRATIFGILWVLLGKRVWFFPNINAEETTFRDLIRFWPEKDEGERPKWTSRLFYAVVAVLVILLLRHHAPDEAARARYQKKVSNIIDDVLEWSPKLALSGMMEKHAGANATETSNFTSGTGSSHAPPTTEGKTTEADPDMFHLMDRSSGKDFEKNR